MSYYGSVRAGMGGMEEAIRVDAEAANQVVAERVIDTGHCG
jgi:hypothetical protein